MGWGNAVFPLLIITPSGGFTGLFLYSPGPGTGNLIGSWTAAAGTDPYGNSFPAGINVTAGNLSNVTLESLSEIMNPGPFLLDAPGDQAVTVFRTVGVNNWVAPAGVTSVTVYCTATGGTGGTGFAPGFGGGGGGGGEVASELTVAVTPGNTYHPTIGAAGSVTTFAGDVVTVTANPGSNGVNGTSGANGTGGLGGTGSTNSVHFNGGKGGNAGLTRLNSGGGGGGGAASPVQPGDNGENPPSAGLGGLGGSASPGPPGTSGGAGGNGGIHSGAGHAGLVPGGGGGGGGDGAAGAAGATGQVVLVYSTLSVATFVALATAAGTDPVTGQGFSAGITTIDPVFGDNWRTFGATTVIGASAVWNVNGADIDMALGHGFRIHEGANARQGVATLAAGTVTVANTTVTANTRFEAFPQDNNTTGALRCSAHVVGTSFTITSSNAADTGVICWRLWEPG